MTIQVGHPHKCPTFFLCAFPGGSQRVNKSTSQRFNDSTIQQVNKSTSQQVKIGHISPIRPMPPNAKAPFSIFFCQIYAPFATYINHNIS